MTDPVQPDSLGFPLETVLIFIAAIAFSVYIDLFAHRKQKEISVKNASLWSCFWIALALAFYGYIWWHHGIEHASQYLAGYALEKSLSIDNLMVFMAIFASFGIRGHLQHRILYWGIIGALIFRAIFVLIGTGLFNAAPWVGFFFAAFVIWSGVQMLRHDNDGSEIEDYSGHWSVRFARKLFPIYKQLAGEKFVIKDAVLNREIESAEKHGLVTRVGKYYITPALLCLFAIEASDIAFAFDSVPAVIAVTKEPLLVYASMIFAILGLRSLYFVLAALNQYLVHLDKAVISLLFFIGFKMFIESLNKVGVDTHIHISPNLSLIIVLSVLALGIIASLIWPDKNRQQER